MRSSNTSEITSRNGQTGQHHLETNDGNDLAPYGNNLADRRPWSLRMVTLKASGAIVRRHLPLARAYVS